MWIGNDILEILFGPAYQILLNVTCGMVFIKGKDRITNSPLTARIHRQLL